MEERGNASDGFGGWRMRRAGCWGWKTIRDARRIRYVMLACKDMNALIEAGSGSLHYLSGTWEWHGGGARLIIPVLLNLSPTSSLSPCLTRNPPSFESCRFPSKEAQLHRTRQVGGTEGVWMEDGELRRRRKSFERLQVRC